MKTRAEQIQDYIDGILTDEELEKFENELLADTSLQEEVNHYREIQKIIASRLSGEKEEQALSETLRQSEAVHRVSQKVKKRSIYTFILPLAAAACLLFFLKIFFFSSSALYELPRLESEVVRGEMKANKYEDVVRTFNEKSYKEARVILDQLQIDEPSNVQYQYYAALTYYGEEKWMEAILKLKPIAYGESVFAPEASYYLASSYLKNNQKEEAIILLEKLKDNPELGEKATEALKEIEKD